MFRVTFTFMTLHLLCFISNGLFSQPVETFQFLMVVAQPLLNFAQKFLMVVAYPRGVLNKKNQIYCELLFQAIRSNNLIFTVDKSIQLPQCSNANCLDILNFLWVIVAQEISSCCLTISNSTGWLLIFFENFNGLKNRCL